MIYKIYQFLIFLTLSLITLLGYFKLLKINLPIIFMQLLITFFIAYFYYHLAFDKDEPKLSILTHLYQIALIILSLTFVIYSFFLIN